MQKLQGPAPILIAHRGYSARYPENTLLAYQAAYNVGAVQMELDLQLTKDNVPVLHHDKTLMRLAGVEKDVREITLQEFLSHSPSYPSRFGDEYKDNNFTSFKTYCEWLSARPEVITYVEIKQESIDNVGESLFYDLVYEEIKRANVEQQCVIISFNYQVLKYARESTGLKIGWVLPQWNDKIREMAEQLQAEFLFCDTESLPDDDEKIWQGQWQWAIYNLDTPESAIAMANRGFGFLETNEIGGVLPGMA